jgi:hypothetical protein
MAALNKLMARGIVPPEVHGVLDYPLAAIIIAGPIVFDFDSTAATVIALAFGAGAAVLAVGTAWPTGIVRVIPPLLHGYADITVTVALICCRSSSASTTARPRFSSTRSSGEPACWRRLRRASSRPCPRREP